MKKCKYCQAELAENGVFCPVCGKENSAPEDQEETVVLEETVDEETLSAAEEGKTEKPKASPAKIAIAVVAVVVLAAVLIALLVNGLGITNKAEGGTVASEPTETAEATVAATEATIPADGNPDDETCKGTYTASDEDVIANGATVVATAGDYQLTNAELQVYYWLEVQSFLSSYGSYAYYFGLDYTQPMDTQVCGLVGSGTWQQFFLANALQSWQNYQSIAAEGEAAGFELSAEDQEYLDTLVESVEAEAASYGFENAKEMLEYNVGAGAEIADYIHFMEVYYKGFQYYSELCSQLEVTEEAMEEYYLANEAEYIENGTGKDSGDYVDVRHILVMPEGGTTDENGTTTYSDDEWEACRVKAQEILDMWLAGEATEDSFAELANEYTQDGNDSNYDGVPDGGLYTNVPTGYMVEPFENWIFDESRVYGDSGLVQTEYGWHVMYFVDRYPIWQYYAESDVLNQMASALIEECAAKYPMTVDYSSILLGYVDMNA